MQIITPGNIINQKVRFGGHDLTFRTISHSSWEATVGPLIVKLFHRVGGSLNWIVIVYHQHFVTDPENAEAGPDRMRLALTRGQVSAELAIEEAERLSDEAFQALGDALGFDVVFPHYG